MGFLYRRRDSRLWWVCWSDESGDRRRESTGLVDLEAARQVLAQLERRVSTRRSVTEESSRTVADHARALLEARARRGKVLAKDETAVLLEHLRGPMRAVPLGDVRYHHVLEWMRELSERRPLDAPPTRTLYMMLYRLFEQAMADGLISANPCRADVQPEPGAPVMDVDRRLSNHFTWAELERLISDPRVDRFRRCQWAVLALTGARVGEVLGMRVRHCDLQRRPLGRLLVAGRWDSKQRRIEPPRGGLPRELPVHRGLAVMLLDHLRQVLPARSGRVVDPDDLLFPAAGGAPQQAGTTLAHLRKDLETIGLRKGNLHTIRRTFFALGRQSGASPEVLRAISGDGRPGDPDVLY
ncbi:MAG TPA: site-specific integrase, partial [Myxococcaceae bacterium]